LFSDYRFYLDGVDFIRGYADRFHHAKEEDVLFEALIENRMPLVEQVIPGQMRGAGGPKGRGEGRAGAGGSLAGNRHRVREEGCGVKLKKFNVQSSSRLELVFNQKPLSLGDPKGWWHSLAPLR
jgi:hypothetical protein